MRNAHRTGVVATFCAVAAIVATIVLTACNTVEGAGKDIKSAGKGIEETAQDNKP